jgi:hypothetical protein
MEILDRLIASLRGCCQSLPDSRQGGDARYTMADIGLSAFSLFFMQSPSLGSLQESDRCVRQKRTKFELTLADLP